MSKKLLILLLALVASFCLAFGLTSCGGSSSNGGDRGGDGGTEHVHSYSAVTTDPTCTERGYTVYTCSCGDSYTGDDIEALGHDFVDGICTRCGASDPDYREASKGLEFTLSEDESYYIVTGIGECADTNLVIPSIYGGLPVKEIGEYAFFNYDDDILIESVFIPGSVETIGEGAFAGCVIESITIPDGITSIRDAVFGYCTSLTNITIPDSVTSIGDAAFRDCASLTNITIPDSVTYIGSCAFDGCTSLTSITIPDSVAYIGSYAFEFCTSLTSITIPDSVTYIGWVAFCGCASLTSITIPNSVTYIGYDAFSGCYSLTKINYNGTMAQWNAIEKGEDWDSNTGNYTVHCTDGDIAK